MRVTTGRGGTIDWWILGFANCFIAVWAFLGIRSMLLYKQDCIEANSTVWNMALAAVTASFLVCCCGGFIGYRVRQAEAEIVHEEDGDEVEVPTNEAEIVSVREVASNDSSVVDVATEGKQRDETTTAEAKGFPEEESRIETEHNHSRTAETKTDIES